MDKLEEIKLLEAQRKKEWRKFLFKDAMFLNCIFYLSIVAAIYCWLKTIVPSWFVDSDNIYLYGSISEDEAYLYEAQRVQERGGMLMVICMTFGFAMSLMKLAFYHTKFIVNFKQVSFYSAYQAFNQKNFLHNYFSFSTENFPIEIIRDSEIVSHDKNVVMAKEKRWEMYLSNGHFSGYIDGFSVCMAHVMSKDTFVDKGRKQAFILHDALTLSVKLQGGFEDEFKLKIKHDKTDKWFGQLFQSSKLGPDKLIKIDDRDFEKLFKVYSNNNEAALKYLTNTRKNVLKKWKIDLDKNLEFTMVENRLTLAFPRQVDLLYPRIYNKVTVRNVENRQIKLNQIFSQLHVFSSAGKSRGGHAV